MFFSWLITSDRNLFTFINRQLKNNIFDILLPRITHLASATFLITTLAMGLVFLRGDLRYWIAEAAVSLTLSQLFVQMIKRKYGRKRPYIQLPDTRTFPNPLIDYSFPSGHTTSSFAVAIVFSLHSFLLMVILVPVALLVSFSRIYLGLHFPSDCIFGAILGTITALLVVNISIVFI